ncbi:MAG: hypothetical protein ACPG4Z_00280 [Chitinophagales bacterium]
MSNQKNILLFFIAFTIMLFVSCDDKKCTDVICGFNETCHQGNCFCLDGYEGDNCDELSFEKYVGNYNVSMSCQNPISAFYTFEVIYSDQSPINEIIFQNFLNSGSSVKGYVGAGADNEGNLLQIPQQNLGSSAFVVTGEGYFQEFGSAGQLQMNIQVAQNGQSNTCNLIFYKQ